jgi:hypothetical protein
MNNADVVKHLDSFDLDTLREHLSEVPPGADGLPVEPLVDDAVRWIDELRRDIVTLVKQVPDPEDVAMAVAIQYVELKSRWIAFNTKMNYERFRKGDCDRLDMCKGACASTLLAHLEELLQSEDIDKITDFLAAPLNRAA